MDIGKIRRVRGMKKRAVYMYLAMCLALALSVTGCSKKTVSSDGVRTVEKDYTKGQIMVVAATERNCGLLRQMTAAPRLRKNCWDRLNSSLLSWGPPTLWRMNRG